MIENYPAFLNRLEQSECGRSRHRLLSADGLLHLGEGNVRPVSIWGIEPGAGPASWN